MSVGYTLDNAWVQARRRLQLLEQAYDAATIGRLRGLGVAHGWRCLEAGGGAGSIARWLCSAVGPRGRVLAVDLDTRFLAEIEADNLDVARADLRSDELPRACFDLVHARAVLTHIAERERVLDSLVASVRPGGWLLLEEADDYAIQALAARTDFAAMMDAFLAGPTRAGASFRWARDLPVILQARGLAQVGSDSNVPVFEGGSPSAEFYRVSMAQLQEQGLLDGTSPAQVAAWDQMLARPGRWFPGLAAVAAWGRRPL